MREGTQCLLFLNTIMRAVFGSAVADVHNLATWHLIVSGRPMLCIFFFFFLMSVGFLHFAQLTWFGVSQAVLLCGVDEIVVAPLFMIRQLKWTMSLPYRVFIGFFFLLLFYLGLTWSQRKVCQERLIATNWGEQWLHIPGHKGELTHNPKTACMGNYTAVLGRINMSLLCESQHCAGDGSVHVVLMRESRQSMASMCLVLTMLKASEDGKPKGLLGPCVPPTAALFLSYLRGNGVRARWVMQSIPWACLSPMSPVLLLPSFVPPMMWVPLFAWNSWSRPREENVEPHSQPRLASKFPASL